jgi:hypothetical protein
VMLHPSLVFCRLSWHSRALDNIAAGDATAALLDFLRLAELVRHSRLAARRCVDVARTVTFLVSRATRKAK